MISYRITLKMDEETTLFYVRAESCRQAVGKMILDMKESVSENVISICQEVLSAAVGDNDDDHLIYESEDYRLECSRNTIIVPDKINEEEPFSQEMEYIHMNLPPHLANAVDEMDVGVIIIFMDEYLEHNCFYLDEEGNETDYGDEDETQFFNLNKAAEYIQKKIIEEYDEPDLPVPHIKSVITTASEYNYTLRQVLKKNNDIISAIDISGISSN